MIPIAKRKSILKQSLSKLTNQRAAFRSGSKNIPLLLVDLVNDKYPTSFPIPLQQDTLEVALNTGHPAG